MKMKQFALVWALALVMTLAGCVDKDNPAVTEPESAVDDGVWTIDDSNMDTSVRPGDDFFMYCNGGYWLRTVVDESTYDVKGFISTEVQEITNNRIRALSLPSKQKLLADIARIDETTTQAEATIQDALNLIASIKTREDAWKVMGQLMAEGFQAPFDLVTFSKGGKVAIFLSPVSGMEWGGFGDDDDADEEQEWGILSTSNKKRKSIKWRLEHDPNLLAAMRPIKGGTTRGFSQAEWPMFVKLCESVGISPDDAYIITDFPLADDVSDEQIASNLEYTKNLHDAAADDLADMMSQMVMDEACLSSADALNEYLSKEGGISKAEFVSRISEKHLRYERARLFVQAYLTPEMKSRTLAYCEDLRETFRERIAANTWMSEGSKRNSLEKLDAMTFNIGYPEEWFSEGFADLSAEGSFLDDVLAIRRTQLNLKRRLAGMDTRRASFHMLIESQDLTIVNAFYAPNYNAMNIFPAWMMEPLYDPSANMAVNYATMYVFGHEIIHGFDTIGSQYDKQGDLGGIWAGETDRQEYLRRARLLMDSYSEMEIMPDALPGIYCDGEYTITENIADLGGFELSYNTYIKYLEENGFKGDELTKQKKMFYKALANIWRGKYSANYALLRTFGDAQGNYKDIHALLRERINGMSRNTDYWYELFGVTPSDKLYLAPEKRAKIW